MRGPFMLVLCIFGGTCCIELACGASETLPETACIDNPIWAQVNRLGVSNIDRSQTLLRSICHITPETVRQLPANPHDHLNREYSRILINNNFEFKIAKDNGDILLFADKRIDANISIEDKWRAIRRPKEEVFRLAAGILRILDQPDDIGTYDVAPFLKEGNESVDDRFGQWLIVRKYSYKNVPCRGRYLKLFVYPGDEELSLKLLYNYPVIVPEVSPSTPISKREAIVAANKCLWINNLFSWSPPTVTPDAESSTVTVIALPNNLHDLKTKIPASTNLKAQYCWEVPYSWNENDHLYRGVLWVSLDKGEVVGAGEQY